MNHVTGVPGADEYAEWYAGYVGLVPEIDVLDALGSQPEELEALLSPVDESASRFRYADGKWSIREVVGHLTDGERVFAIRALCFSRGEKSPLPGFDEKEYMRNSAYDQIPLAELLDEFRLLRKANVMMLRRLGAEEWARLGVASGYDISVRALGYVMVGHPRHHMKVLAGRYLPVLGLTSPKFSWM